MTLILIVLPGVLCEKRIVRSHLVQQEALLSQLSDVCQVSSMCPIFLVFRVSE